MADIPRAGPLTTPTKIPEDRQQQDCLNRNFFVTEINFVKLYLHPFFLYHISNISESVTWTLVKNKIAQLKFKAIPSNLIRIDYAPGTLEKKYPNKNFNLFKGFNQIP